MRTDTFKSILHGAVHQDELDPTSADLTPRLAAKITSFLETRLREGWEWDFWPEITPVERRAYRNEYDVNTTYALDAEVFNPDDEKYYVSLVANNIGNDPATATTFWELATELDRYIAYSQTGKNTIDAVEGVYMRNPNTSNNPGRLNFWRSANGIQVSSLAPARVWIKFRLPPPKLTSVVYDPTTIYAAGGLAYLDATGENYLSLQGSNQGNSPSTATDKWARIEIPHIFSGFLKKAAYADHLNSDGQRDKSSSLLDDAYTELERVWDVEFPGNGQHEAAGARTY